MGMTCSGIVGTFDFTGPDTTADETAMLVIGTIPASAGPARASLAAPLACAAASDLDLAPFEAGSWRPVVRRL